MGGSNPPVEPLMGVTEAPLLMERLPVGVVVLEVTLSVVGVLEITLGAVGVVDPQEA